MEHQSLVTLVPWTLIAQLCNLLIQMLLIKKLYSLLNPMAQDHICMCIWMEEVGKLVGQKALCGNTTRSRGR